MPQTTTLESNLKKTLSATDEFANLMAPISNKLDLTYIRHVRIHADLSKLTFSNRPDVVDWYFSHKLYQLGYSERNPSDYREGFVLCDTWSKDTIDYEKIGRPWREQFNCDHPFALHIKSRSHVDILELATHRNNSEINLEYIQSQDLITETFRNYLKSNFLKQHQTHTFMNEFQKNNDFHLVKNQDVIPIDLEHFGLPVSFNSITRRDLECCYWLSRGKRSSEIATILGLSVRSIESYFSKIKTKFNCNNLFQVGAFIGKHANTFKALYQSQYIGD